MLQDVMKRIGLGCEPVGRGFESLLAHSFICPQIVLYGLRVLFLVLVTLLKMWYTDENIQLVTAKKGW